MTNRSCTPQEIRVYPKDKTSRKRKEEKKKERKKERKKEEFPPPPPPPPRKKIGLKEFAPNKEAYPSKEKTEVTRIEIMRVIIIKKS